MRKIRGSKQKRFGTVKLRAKKQHCSTFELPILLKRKTKEKSLRKRAGKMKKSLHVSAHFIDLICRRSF